MIIGKTLTSTSGSAISEKGKALLMIINSYRNNGHDTIPYLMIPVVELNPFRDGEYLPEFRLNKLMLWIFNQKN